MLHFVNNMLPPHNVVVEDHPELSHEALAMMPGEEFDVAFQMLEIIHHWCGPHKIYFDDRYCAVESAICLHVFIFGFATLLVFIMELTWPVKNKRY